jgi:hypothetical protein
MEASKRKVEKKTELSDEHKEKGKKRSGNS